MRFKHEFFFPFRCGQIQTFTHQIHIQMCVSDSDSDPFNKQTPPVTPQPDKGKDVTIWFHIRAYIIKQKRKTYKISNRIQWMKQNTKSLKYRNNINSKMTMVKVCTQLYSQSPESYPISYPEYLPRLKKIRLSLKSPVNGYNNNEQK